MPYRPEKIAAACIVCGEHATVRCARCGHPVCFRHHSLQERKRCFRCEGEYLRTRRASSWIEVGALFLVVIGLLLLGGVVTSGGDIVYHYAPIGHPMTLIAPVVLFGVPLLYFRSKRRLKRRAFLKERPGPSAE